MTIKLSIILPYFNEEGWIGPTIDSLTTQRDRSFHLILVDNGSTDAGPEEARAHAAVMDDAVEHVRCDIPGKTHALAAGLDHVKTPLVATCDADTRYPPDYVTNMLGLFASYPDAAMAMAIDLYAEMDATISRKRIAKIMRKSRRLSAQCHAGGYAQAFRTDLLRKAGGFDAHRWPFVLEDHEIAYRVMQMGPALYHRHHVCFPSTRRMSRKAVNWTAFERFVYRHTPASCLGWFFYDFLGPRLASRNSFATALREKQWTHPGA